MKIEVAGEPTAAIVEAVQRLTRQLSSSAAVPSPDDVAELVTSPATDLFVAVEGDQILGLATLVTFRLPTGVRGWVEDIVVDDAGRGEGVGTALIDAMIAVARERRCRTLDLTSRPSREAANRLYQRIGF